MAMMDVLRGKDPCRAAASLARAGDGDGIFTRRERGSQGPLAARPP